MIRLSDISQPVMDDLGRVTGFLKVPTGKVADARGNAKKLAPAPPAPPYSGPMLTDFPRFARPHPGLRWVAAIGLGFVAVMVAFVLMAASTGVWGR
ncbi:MAG: hypothetical protein ABI682_08580 [Acidobacteriota bacterium]